MLEPETHGTTSHSGWANRFGCRPWLDIPSGDGWRRVCVGAARKGRGVLTFTIQWNLNRSPGSKDLHLQMSCPTQRAQTSYGRMLRPGLAKRSERNQQRVKVDSLYSTPPRAAGILDEAVGELPHGVEVLLSVLDVLEGRRVVGLDEALNYVLQGLLVLKPLLDLRVRDNLGVLGGRGSFDGGLGRLPRASLLLAGLLLGSVALPLATPRSRRSSGRRRSGLGGSAAVVVHTPHVVPQVPLAGKAVAGDGALATIVSAQVWLLAMAMHGMRLALMAKKAGSGREAGVLAALNLAAVRLEVRVHEFAVLGLVRVSLGVGEPRLILTRSCT